MDNNWLMPETEEQRRGLTGGLGLKQPAIPKQAYGLGAGAPEGVGGMTAKDFERQMMIGSSGMGNIGSLEAQADMQPEYAKALRAMPGQHWTQQATRAMSGIGQGMAALEKQALLKTAGDQTKYTRDKMFSPDTAGPEPVASTKLDIFKSKMPDWLRNWGGGN